MCGKPDHLHETTSQYDHATGVMRFAVRCVKCVWSRVLHEEQYSPAFDPGGCASFMSLPAMRSATKAHFARLESVESKVIVAAFEDMRDQSVRRAA